MSTLKTNNIEHLDASTPSIQTTIGGGTILAGVTTVSDALKVGTGITFNTDGSCSLANDKFTINTQGSFFINTDRIICAQDGQLTVKRDIAGSFFYGGTTADPQRIVLNSDGTASFVGSATVGTYDSTSNSTTGSQLNSIGKVVAQRTSGQGTSDVFAGYQGNTKNFSVTAEGSAVFAGNITLSTAGSGIDFSATSDGSGTTTSELLDDYEEGTWVPTYTPENNSFTSITYDAVVSGKYQKVGSTVWIQGFIRTDALTVGSASGDLFIGNLPYTPFSSAGENCSINIGSVSNFSGDAPYSMMTTSGNRLAIYYRTTSNGDADLLNVSDMQAGTVANANGIFFTGQYSVI